MKPYIFHLFWIEQFTAVKNKSRLDDRFMDSFPIVFLKLIPFCQDGNGMGVIARFIRIINYRYQLSVFFWRSGSQLIKICINLFCGNFGIIYENFSLFIEK